MTPVRIDRRHLLAGSAGVALATALGPLPGRTAGRARAVGVTATRRAGPAPLGLTLTAEATGFDTPDPRHDLMYFWRTGDSGEWSALSDNMVLSRAKAERTGFSISHTYDTPGTYTVEVMATDGVDEATGTVRIEVADPDVFYAGATHVVSQAGNF